MEQQLIDFLDHLAKERRMSQHTVLSYGNDLRQFSQYCASLSVMDVRAVDHTVVRSWTVSLMDDEKMGSTSVNRKLSALRSFYKFLLRTDQATTDPTTRSKLLKTPKRLPEFVAVVQLNQLLDGIDFADDVLGKRDRLILEVLYHTGLRRAELMGLRLRDVNLSGNELKVLGKRNKERIVPFAPALVPTITAYMSARGLFGSNNLPDAPLIASADGRKISATAVYRTVNKYLRMVSSRQKLSPHVLRHSFATHMLNNGADLNAIKEILGHIGLAATQVYTHNTIERLNAIHKQAHPRA